MAGEWREVTIGDLVWLHDQQITPASAPAELFYHYSIPAYDSGQRPALETGSAIGSNKFVVPRGAVLVSKLNPRLPRVWAPDIPDKARAVASTEFLVLSPRDGVDRRFLKYLMLSPAVRSAMEARVTGTSGSHQRVRPSDLLSISVEIPVDLQEQRAIAHILGTLDDRIELNRRMSETLEAMARALFKAWFVDFEPVRAKMEGRWQRGQSLPGLPAHLYDLFPDRLVDSELGEIPEGWKVGKLGELADIQGGKQLPTDECRPSGMFPVFGANGIMGYTNRTTHDEFVIAFGRVGAYCGSVHWTYSGAWINNNASSVVPKRWHEFVLQTMIEADFESMRTGSAQPFIPNSSLAALPVIRAADEVMDEFCRILRALRLKQHASLRESRTLAALRDALLPKLIRGEIRLKDAERFLKERISC
jgi:type I restriction enzyme S subunit